jgi:hypothetical protein
VWNSSHEGLNLPWHGCKLFEDIMENNLYIYDDIMFMNNVRNDIKIKYTNWSVIFMLWVHYCAQINHNDLILEEQGYKLIEYIIHYNLIYFGDIKYLNEVKNNLITPLY